ncbi:MAG: UvrABC system protein C [Alphaproteobacteria bacterium MarineAlpha6_Bin6]|nr:excinuclease ABC subunit C [Pelagibacteraceae bacterium]PPR31354.1 MAG: UvrABC system protein C [Alphaproteobacteria bacterium MarineAlpha6_Bin6]PPR33496.1 MAG: UvrABC system protein C [Alphaproteobacteria bacterium MarineAlpha6_Bin5]|tara:strand:+ start:1229 stop:3064 length:1836 start_codon:yes stop_codon:yes gene_type:complete
MNGLDIIKNKLENITNRPGIYQYLNSKNEIIYIGKAKNLKKRISSYKNSSSLSNRIQRMVYQINNIETITTKTEAEAFLLESNLIKKFKPKFNIVLRDDKSLPYILISTKNKWPQILKHRGRQKNIGTYFGPYPSAGAVDKTINSLQKAFLIRSCTDSFFKARNRACLLYQIKKCSAPCVKKINENDYLDLSNQTILFLKGKNKKIQSNLNNKMRVYSLKKKYEKAADLRDRIKALNQIQEKQSINISYIGDADVISIKKKNFKACIQVFYFRGGNNLGGRYYFPRHEENEKEENILQSFLGQYYSDKIVTKLILINKKIPEKKLLINALNKKSGYKINIETPLKGQKKIVLKNAEKNAEKELDKKFDEQKNNLSFLKKIKFVFKLKKIPKTIEIYDISHISGEFAVGAMVSFNKNGFIKNNYRKFNIKGTFKRKKILSKSDDYSSIYEVLNRRLKKDSKTILYPDLMIIDGGKGHFNTALNILKNLNLEKKIELASIAKGENRNEGNENFYINNDNKIKFNSNDKTLFFLQRLRDEAHRFAITSHRTRRSKINKSILDEIEGIGPNKKRDLLKYFGSSEQIKIANINEIQKVKGINKNVAKKIYNFFHEN